MLFEGLMRGPEVGASPERDELAIDEIGSRKREADLKTELSKLKVQLSSVDSDAQLQLLMQVREIQRAIEAERRMRLHS
jgi:hypothetical protein